MLGDFNAVSSHEDRFQGRPITNYEIQDITNCLQNSDLGTSFPGTTKVMVMLEYLIELIDVWLILLGL